MDERADETTNVWGSTLNCQKRPLATKVEDWPLPVYFQMGKGRHIKVYQHKDDANEKKTTKRKANICYRVLGCS